MKKQDLLTKQREWLTALGATSEELPAAMLEAASRAKKNGQVIVLVTGVFDLLHTTHLEFLQAAAQLGDMLLVGIETDKRVQQMKGKERPLRSELVRLTRLQQLKIAHHVFILPEKFGESAVREQLLKKIAPDILAASLKTAHLASKKLTGENLGFEVVLVPLSAQQVSTTAILKGDIAPSELLFSEDRELVLQSNHGKK